MKRLCLLALLLIVLTLLTAAVLYLAGCTYFLLNKTLPQQVDLGTWLLYWQAYGSDPAQRKRLLGALALPSLLVVTVLLGLIPALAARPRALHGDARWASTREIEQAGLL